MVGADGEVPDGEVVVAVGQDVLVHQDLLALGELPSGVPPSGAAPYPPAGRRQWMA